MSEKPLPFVVNDRRKFTSEGELRPDAPASEKRESESREPAPAEPEVREPTSPQPISTASRPSADDSQPGPESEDDEANLPPAPTPEQMEQARVAFTATADRLDIAIRAANPGMDHPPAMSFDQLVQSVYMQAILQLGGGAQEGQQPQVDLLGARQSIDMLAILAEKTQGNLDEKEQRLLDSALFELRLAFLEITQALARSAQSRPAGPGAPGMPGARPGPTVVR